MRASTIRRHPLIHTIPLSSCLGLIAAPVPDGFHCVYAFAALGFTHLPAAKSIARAKATVTNAIPQ